MLSHKGGHGGVTTFDHEVLFQQHLIRNNVVGGLATFIV